MPGKPADEGSWMAAIFFGLILIGALLFAAYILWWNGGNAGT